MLNNGVFKIDPTRADHVKLIQVALGELPPLGQFSLAKYSDRSSVFDLFCAVIDGRPRFSLGIIRWDRMPFFSLLDFRSFEPVSSAFRNRGLLDDLFAAALTAMHEEKRFTFYYATRARPYTTKHLLKTGELAPVRGLKSFENYDFTIEARVPAHVEPRYDYQVKLLSFENRDVDYWIKRGTLKAPSVAKYLGLGVDS